MSMFKRLLRQKPPRVRCEIPLEQEFTARAQATGAYFSLESIAPDAFKGHTFLFADDDQTQRTIAATLIAHYAGAVDTAADGLAAYALYCAAPSRYSALFIDLNMPFLGGYQLATQIRASTYHTAKTIPIIAISGEIAYSDARSDPFNYYLQKPYQLHALAAVIAASL